jgi:hypothetical protein
MKSLSCFVIAVIFASRSFAAGTPNAEAQSVSIIRLIATPERYDGKLVRVVGYLNMAFEGDSISFHEEDFRRNLVENALWVEPAEGMRKELTKLSRQYVLIEGVFDASDRGHMGLFSGAITNITRADAWKP